jgi:hypothetical protein
VASTAGILQSHWRAELDEADLETGAGGCMVAFELGFATDGGLAFEGGFVALDLLRGAGAGGGSSNG